MISFYFFVVFLALSVSASPPSSSPNTRTFIIKDLKKQIEDIPVIRTFSPTSSPIPFVGDNDADDMYSMKRLRAKLIKLITHKSHLRQIEIVVSELYRSSPDYNHMDHIYFDPKSKTSGTVLHFAVMTGNIGLLDLAYYFCVSTTVENSKGLTPLETAYEEGNGQMIAALVTHFPFCIDEPFFEYPTVIHYAAAKNNLELLTFIMDASGFVHLDFHVEEGDDQEYPLEIALKKANIRVADHLMRNEFYCPFDRIKSIYLDCLNNFSRKHHVAISILEYYQELMYLTNSEDLDIMLLAIKKNNDIIVQNITYLGYKKDQVSYDLEQKSVEYGASQEVTEALNCLKWAQK